VTTRPVAGKEAANDTHERAGSAVPTTMEEMGVPTPEHLPTSTQSIQLVRRALARQKRMEEEDRLGLWALSAEEPQDGAEGS